MKALFLYTFLLAASAAAAPESFSTIEESLDALMEHCDGICMGKLGHESVSVQGLNFLWYVRSDTRPHGFFAVSKDSSSSDSAGIACLGPLVDAGIMRLKNPEKLAKRILPKNASAESIAATTNALDHLTNYAKTPWEVDSPDLIASRRLFDSFFEASDLGFVKWFGECPELD